MSQASLDPIESFLTRWQNSGAAERANYQMFLAELCDLLEVPRPDPTSPDPENNLYVFDRAITRDRRCGGWGRWITPHAQEAHERSTLMPNTPPEIMSTALFS